MKKFLVNTFFVFSITVLVISFFLLTFIFLWENRSVIAKHLGIELKDNCRIYNSQLQCEYINVASKNLSLRLKEIKVKADIIKFIKKDEPFIFVKVDRGRIYLKTEKHRKKLKNSPVNYAFFLIYFIKSDINRIDIFVDTPQGRFALEDFSFLSSYNSFHIKRPFRFSTNRFSGTVDDFTGIIEANSINVKKLKAVINGNNLSATGNFDYEGNFTFKGSFEGERFNAGKLSLNNFRILFNISQYRGLIRSSNKIFSESVKIREFYAKNTEGSFAFSGKDRFNGNVKLKTDSVKLRNVEGSSSYYSGKLLFSIKEKLFKTEGSLSISSVKYGGFSSLPLKSDVSVTYRNKKLKVRGKVLAGNIPIQFDYRNRVLTLTGEGLNLREILSLYRPVDIDGKIWGKVAVNFQNKTVTADIDGKDLDIYGVYFKGGRITSQLSIKDGTGRFSVGLKNIDSYCFITGNLLGREIDADVTFDNINTKNFIYGKKYRFWGRLTGTGKLYGHLPKLSVSITGTAHSFYYDSINLNDVGFNFLFESGSKNIRVSFKRNNTAGLLALKLKPFSLHLHLSFKNSNVSVTKDFLRKKMPDIFSHITPQTVTGTVKISLKKGRWKVKTDIKEGKVTVDKLKDFLFVRMKGEFSDTEKFMKLSFFRKGFSISSYTVDKISGDISLLRDRLTAQITGEGLENFEHMKLKVYTVFELNSRNIEGEVDFSLKKGEFSNYINSSFRGNIKNIKGFLKERGYLKEKPFIRTDLLYSVSYADNVVKTDIKTDILSITLPEKTGINFYRISGSVDLPMTNFRKAAGNLSISSFTVSRSYIYFFESSPLKISLKDGMITGNPVSFTGILTGNIKKFSYDMMSNTISIYSEGSFDRNLLSIVTKYINTSGKLRYRLSFKGNLKDWKKRLYFSVFSDNIDIKTSYTVGIVRLKEVFFELSEGVFKLKIDGKTTDSILGKSNIRLSGKGGIEKFYGNFNGYSQLFPVKFKNIFQGSINSNLKLKVYSKHKTLKENLSGKILVSGKLKLEKNLDSISKKKKKTAPVESLEGLESLSLNLYVESYIPLYMYGKWGKAYAEFDIKVKGTGKNPRVNGNINIIYGEIYFMKNRYSIDFANIKIIDNEPYISARVSTSVADTFIFIDISGPASSPKINFFSNPPKPKNEILSILLLKDTPSALENMPVFKTVGKLLYAILPFKPSEETGLFNTGFEVSILPQYSPATGISASIYGKRNLTRRIFVALSKPLGQVEEERIGGWYGIGIKLKERTSFQYKFFETGNQEFGIVFNLPFDF